MAFLCYHPRPPLPFLVMHQSSLLLLYTLLLSSATLLSLAEDSQTTTQQSILSFPLSTRSPSHASHRRRRRLTAATTTNSTTAALFHGYGTHYVDLWCGTPPQRQTVIVDTGSDRTAFTCKPCTECGKREHSMFDTTSSSSFKKLSCGECFRGTCNKKSDTKECVMKAHYREGSGWKAFEARDVCYLGGPHHQAVMMEHSVSSTDEAVDGLDPHNAAAFKFPLTFGCQTSVTGAFADQIEDGIMGLQALKTSFWSQVYDNVVGRSNVLQDPSFSLCFGQAPAHISPKGSRGGVMTMGGVDPRVSKSVMVYAEAEQRKYFSIHVRKFYLQASEATPVRVDISEEDLNYERVIIDSGATDTYFTRKLQEPFQHVWKQLVGKEFDYNRKHKTLDKIPSIIIQLNGTSDNQALVEKYGKLPQLAGDLDPEHPFDVLLIMRPEQYMEYYDKAYHVRFHFDPDEDSSLGASAMIGRNVFFDVVNNRIGLADSDCDYERIVAQHVVNASVEEEGGSPESKSTDEENARSEGIEKQIAEHEGIAEHEPDEDYHAGDSEDETNASSVAPVSLDSGHLWNATTPIDVSYLSFQAGIDQVSYAYASFSSMYFAASTVGSLLLALGVILRRRRRRKRDATARFNAKKMVLSESYDSDESDPFLDPWRPDGIVPGDVKYDDSENGASHLFSRRGEVVRRTRA